MDTDIERIRRDYRASLESQLRASQADKAMHFTVVLFGDACNGQSSLLAVITGGEMDIANHDFKLEPTTKEVKLRYQNARYDVSLIDAGEGIVASEEDKQCFSAAEVLVLVVDLAGDIDIAIENIEDRWLPVVADKSTTPHMILVPGLLDWGGVM